MQNMSSTLDVNPCMFALMYSPPGQGMTPVLLPSPFGGAQVRRCRCKSPVHTGRVVGGVARGRSAAVHTAIVERLHTVHCGLVLQYQTKHLLVLEL